MKSLKITPLVCIVCVIFVFAISDLCARDRKDGSPFIYAKFERGTAEGDLKDHVVSLQIVQVNDKVVTNKEFSIAALDQTYGPVDIDVGVDLKAGDSIVFKIHKTHGSSGQLDGTFSPIVIRKESTYWIAGWYAPFIVFDLGAHPPRKVTTEYEVSVAWYDTPSANERGWLFTIKLNKREIYPKVPDLGF